eukprot:m51a1_g10044 putative 3 5 -cyclic nucleotide phosphodiesterase family protein (825) ;mRNA; f:28007-30927
MQRRLVFGVLLALWTFSGAARAERDIMSFTKLAAIELDTILAEVEEHVRLAASSVVAGEDSALLQTHLGPLSFVPAKNNSFGIALAVDQDPGRRSEFFMLQGLVQGPEGSAETNGTACTCQEDFDSWCRVVQATGEPCTTPCALFCGAALGRVRSLLIDPFVWAAFYNRSGIELVMFMSGDPEEGTQWGRVWVLPDMASDPPFVLQEGADINENWNLTFPNTDSVPRWSEVIVDEVSGEKIVTVGVAAIGKTKGYLGTMFAEMSLEILHDDVMYEYWDDTEIWGVVVEQTGRVVMQSTGHNVFLEPSNDYWITNSSDFDLATLFDSITASGTLSGTGATKDKSGGSFLYGFYVLESTEWVVILLERAPIKSANLPLVITLSVTIPAIALVTAVVMVFYFRSKMVENRVRALEKELHKVTTTNVIGTPVEKVVSSLMRIKSKTKLNDGDREEILDLVTLITSNKLYKADFKAAKNAGIDSDIDAFLKNMFVKELDSLGSSQRSTQKQTMYQSASLSAPQLVLKGQIEDFTFDVRSLTTRDTFADFAMSLFEANDLVDALEIPSQKLQRFLSIAVEGYNDVPYHNWQHAADVAQALHVLINLFQPLCNFSNVEVAAALAGENRFLEQTKAKLAMRYNCVSTLENMHASQAMSLLLRDDTTNFISHLSNEGFWDFYRVVIGLVLATDMTQHVEIVSQLSAKATAGKFDWSSKTDRLFMLKVLIKFADVSNPVRPWDVCSFWANRVMEEFFLQGEREKDVGLPVSPFMDRSTTDIPRCQEAFIKYVVLPFAEQLERINPEFCSTVASAKDNLAKWTGLSTTCCTTTPH